jgi:hypothetical protein
MSAASADGPAFTGMPGMPRSPAPIEMPMSWRSHISSSCATCFIANREPDHAVAPVVGRTAAPP